MNDFDTLVKEGKPKEIKEQFSEKKDPDFSMEDYLDFAEKFPSKPKLAKDWVALALLFKEILKYEELEEEMEKRRLFEHFNPNKTLNGYHPEEAKDLKRLFDINKIMSDIKELRPPKWWEYLFRPSVEVKWNEHILKTYYNLPLSEESRKKIHKEVMAEINEAVQENKRTVYRTLYEKLGYVF